VILFRVLITYMNFFIKNVFSLRYLAFINLLNINNLTLNIVFVTPSLQTRHVASRKFLGGKGKSWRSKTFVYSDENEGIKCLYLLILRMLIF